jgi:hypothetical protein
MGPGSPEHLDPQETEDVLMVLQHGHGIGAPDPQHFTRAIFNIVLHGVIGGYQVQLEWRKNKSNLLIILDKKRDDWRSEAWPAVLLAPT